jgi:hypothetical protein
MPELGIGLGIQKGAVPKAKLLLDKYDIDAAFSLRKVRAEYNGPCVRVRNSSGDLADIGFTNQGALDVDALNAHCGDNDGTVQTWYNQSTEGGRFNAVQDTAADQPIIYDASAGGYLGYVENTGNMYLRFENQLTGVTDAAVVYENTTVPGVDTSAYVVGEHETSGVGGEGILVGHQSIEGFGWAPSSGLSLETYTGDGQNEKHAGFVYVGGSDKFAVVDGYVCASTSNTGSASFDYIFTKSKNGTDQDNHDFVGKVWEVFLSTSDLSANRIALENSILLANGLTVPEKTLLEKYGGGAAAYSLRSVNREYVGPIVEVRGNSTEDVYLTSNGVVNEDRIAALCTGVDGFVKTWYDQSGNGNDATQATDANQPKIYDSSTGMVLENGKPAIGNWLSAQTILIASFGQIYNTVNIYSVSTDNQGSSVGYIVSGDTSTGFRLGRNGQGADIWLYDGSVSKTTSAESSGQALVSVLNGVNPLGYFNGVSRTFDNTLNGNGMSGAYIGNHPSLSGLGQIDGNLQELIIYPSDQSANRTGIESNINSHYVIYQEATASPASGFLADYSGAAAAYSVRQLGDANICMKVRRSSDNATRNIGFGADGFVDTTAISDFCGSGDGFVVTWYDQSGNAVDASQSTAADQPKIYDGTDGVVKENGKAGIAMLNDAGMTMTDINLNDFSIFTAMYHATNSSVVYGGTVNRILFTNTTTVLQYSGITDGVYSKANTNQQTLLSAFRDDGVSESVFQNGLGLNQTTQGGAGAIVLNNINKIRPNDISRIYQELIIYPSDQSSNRTGIETNINESFKIYPDTDTTPESGFLNEFSGAAAAYSVRKLGDSPVCMRVRKTVSAVDYYQIIGFDANGDLDTAAIEEFGGSNDVFVQTWYDQSGNGKHAAQTTAANQPKIYDGTNGMLEENGKPAVEFDGSNDCLTMDLISDSTEVSICAVHKNPHRADYDPIIGVGDDNGYALTTQSNKYNLFYRTVADQATTSDAPNNTQAIVFAYTKSATSQVLYSNGTEIQNITPATMLTPTTGSSIGAYDVGDSATKYDGFIQEIILYASDQSSNRPSIESNINNYFLVHQVASTSPATGLLSEAPGAAAAYSVRQLGDALLCMKVASGATGNPTKNIGFKNGVVDTAAIEEFCGNNDGFVATWYDQSGNDNNADQGTHASRPKIYDNATGIVKENKKPALSFAVNNIFDLSSTLSISNENFFYVTGETVDVTLYGDGTSYTRNQLTRYLSYDGTTFYTVNITQPSGYSLNSVVEGSGIYQNGTKLDDFSSSLTITADSILQAHTAGAYQEFILYTDDQSANRTGIETNINNYFKIYTPFTSGLLDSYHGATAAYSLRRLSSAYTGDAIEVTSNGSTQDIGFDIEGNLDTSALATFCSGTDGFVKTWYDQSGNGNDAVQATAANQPKIYDGSTGVVKENGKPAVEFDGDVMGVASTDTFDELSVFVVANKPEEEVNSGFVSRLGDTSGAGTKKGDFHIRSNSAFIRTIAGNTDGSGYDYPEINTSNIISFIWDGSVQSAINTPLNEGEAAAYMNSKLVDQTAVNGNFSAGSDELRINYAASVASDVGKYQEVLVYNSDQSSNRVAIEKNLNAYYEVYEQPLLDVVPDAAAAYSLRKLRAGYTGPAINVFNGTDYKDIYFRRDGSLDTAAITKFCGSNDGTVAIWYDQSGNANHAEQTVSIRRPKIYDGTNGLLIESGLPIMEFVDDDTSIDDQTFDFNFPDLRNQSEFHAYIASTTSDPTYLLFYEDGNTYSFVAQDNSNLTQKSQGYGSPTLRVNGSQQTIDVNTTRDDIHGYLDGKTIQVHNASTLGWTEFNAFNYRRDVPTDFYGYSGKVYEMIFYNTDVSASNEVIEANINHYYSIY